MTIFDFKDYKLYLKHIIESSKRGIITRLAEAAGCQRSYLSQALSTQVNLTSDQIYNISIFLGLNEDEQEFLLLLLEHEKAASFSYKKRIQKKIETLKQNSKRLTKKVSSKNSKEINPKYYSAWYYSAVHIASSINEIRTEKDFARLLNLDLVTIRKTLKDLKSWSLVSFKDEAWSYNDNYSLHLKDDSLLNRLNHANWRTYALSKPIEPEKNINYTSVFTVSKKDLEILRADTLKLLEEQRKKISPSEPEELVVFNCDFVSIKN